MKKLIIIFTITIFFLLPFSANGDYKLSLRYPKIFDIGPEGGILEYVRYLYLLGLVLIGAAALFALVYGGFIYMTSDLITSKEEAKKWMLGAITGLSLGFLSYLILFTINPDLVKWKLEIKEAKLSPPITHITCPFIVIDSTYYRYEYPLKAEGCTYCAEKWEYDDSDACRHAQGLIDCGNEIPEEYKNLYCEKICCKKKITEYHLECENGTCKKIPGPGPDDPSCKGKEAGDECKEDKKYHLVCRNQMCLLVEGEDEDDPLCAGKKQGDECGEETTWSCEDPGGGICVPSKEICLNMGWEVTTGENTDCPSEKPYCCKPQEYTCRNPEGTMRCVTGTQCPNNFPILRTDKTCPAIRGKTQICCEQSECQKKGYHCEFLVCHLPYEQMPFDCGSGSFVCCGIYSCQIQYGGTCYLGGCPRGTKLIPEGSCKPGYVCCGVTVPPPPPPPPPRE